MKEIITISAALVGSYAAFMGVLILFAKVFFPFYTKEQLEKRNAMITPKQATKRQEMRRKAIAQLTLRSDITLERAAYTKLARG